MADDDAAEFRREVLADRTGVEDVGMRRFLVHAEGGSGGEVVEAAGAMLL